MSELDDLLEMLLFEYDPGGESYHAVLEKSEALRRVRDRIAELCLPLDRAKAEILCEVAAAEERERCARVCEELKTMWEEDGEPYALAAAAAEIRRGG